MQLGSTCEYGNSGLTRRTTYTNCIAKRDLLSFLAFYVSTGSHSNDARQNNHEQKSAGYQKVVHKLSFLSERLVGSPDKIEDRA